MGMILTSLTDDEVVNHVDRSNPEVNELCQRLEAVPGLIQDEIAALDGECESLREELTDSEEKVEELESDIEKKDVEITNLKLTIKAMKAKAEETKSKVVYLENRLGQG